MNADSAMYRAKFAGRNNYKYYSETMRTKSLHRLDLENEIRKALDNNQFQLFYQPKVDAETWELVGAEALLRWHHPQSGLISPAVFIPLAEETGLINQIGDWVFDQACAQLRHWRNTFGIEFQISVNTSLLQWIDASAPMNRWFSHLDEQGISGAALHVEFTEALLMNAGDRITNRLLDLREAGVPLVIDDFGTGYSSLSSLKQFDIDSIKIDQSFVRNIERDKNDRDLCEAIIVMAHKLGIEVVAEGVETREQDRILRDFGCDYAQGYLYSRPVPAIDLTALIASRT